MLTYWPHKCNRCQGKRLRLLRSRNVSKTLWVFFQEEGNFFHEEETLWEIDSQKEVDDNEVMDTFPFKGSHFANSEGSQSGGVLLLPIWKVHN